MPTNSSNVAPYMYESCDVVAELWKEVLQLQELPLASDNFFALGGDSMSMVMLGARIKEELGVDIPDDSVLGAQTLYELSALVDAELIARRELGAPSVDSTATLDEK